ncbi:2-polyprenyl-3-methyl-6-methoxy-1,4-benzoquinone monooxygenase [Candidatus Nitrosacidococcus sp. I8]|uniref:2-polyprenyl-3-methyl-6-methoxy-1,4-benzoquinone monooxygenase n=1 Tax=Candidatus Nitrosacidococcus sp. I8 TaxID=2942908 RepID=UPI0022280BD0|nr:2-polyprenyl-3-methyl-6-methoxy-1,4-benzoquinone monooxygenase [Candidatus Nitrosacidococcus sp. I8]CAH9018990.1 3-demethoxyubiquinol 3-hydroxylase [Candidatus Nitrosacidococcus sp. I8]
MEEIKFSQIDQFIINFDDALKTIFGPLKPADRPNPALNIEEGVLSEAEKNLSGKLMRVNHAGEIAAQALYRGQALTARLEEVRSVMDHSAQEENDHLVWCRYRVQELGTHTSYLDIFWYGGSFMIGVLAGIAGDKWSLGFVTETEYQVVKHLEEHLEKFPAHDMRTRAIVEQMKQDEFEHAITAIESGGIELPVLIKTIMKITSKIMTRTAYWI